MSRESILNCEIKDYRIKSISLIIILMFVISAFFGILSFKNESTTVSATTYFVGGTGNGNYTSIQTAIDKASEGDTVFVYTGTYTEHVLVNKSINLIGENRDNTTISGNGTADVVSVTANGVVISGFTVKNSGKSYLYGGIKLIEVNKCSIMGNNLSSNRFAGIILHSASNNIIRDNIISQNNGTGFSIRSYSSHNRIINNSIYNNCLSNDSEISGLLIGGLSNNNRFFKNTITNNMHIGIAIYNSNNVLMRYNKISANQIGVVFSSNSKGHVFYLNDFINNTHHVISESSFLTWNSPEKVSYLYNNTNFTNYLGNYWDNYSGSDINGDGIGDTAYNIGSDKDSYPLVKLSSNYIIIPSTTKVELVEVYSNSTNKTVSITTQIARLNASITGDLNGTINITELELVWITSGAYAGSGFFQGIFRASIENRIYEGHWQGSMFNKSGERRFYLKGTLLGGVQGITDGYLMESSLKSGKYDLFNSTGTISHLRFEEQLIPTFAQISINGTLDVKKSVNITSEIYILQSLFKGNATGYYNKSLSVVLTHIRINNKTQDYYGYGFSKLSYVSSWGSGSGWTYDRTISPQVSNLTGFFTPPLWGIVFGILNETGAKRTLSLTIIRLDLGSTPSPIVKIQVWGPRRASPGQKINYFIEIRNYGLKTAYNNEIVLVLSNNVTYLSNTGDGTYNNSTHSITWRYNITAKSKKLLSVKCKIKWGLTLGTRENCTGYIKDYLKNNTLASTSWSIFITTAVDPNIKSGPDGFVIPGQILNYRIEFENEGTGIAYGVYFTDTLSKYLDDSTLEIGSVFNKKDDSLISRPGIYDPDVRTITWFVGEVGPGEGGYANFSIQVPEDAKIGTEILNYGIVYFPSAPEVTKTNGIVSIVMINKNPTADAGTNIVVETLEEIIFDGSGSFDPDGMIINYTWDFGDGGSGYGKETTYSYPDDGDYKVELTVTDNWGGMDSHEINVKVLNRAPKAILEVAPAEFYTNELISFNAKSSFDLDGIVKEYYFDFGDNTNSGWTHIPFISHRYSDGTRVYNVELSVKDDDGAIGKDSMNITINNVKPKAEFIVEPLQGDITTIFEFKSTSSDTDGKVTNFYWSFGDGSIANKKEPVHQYEAKGAYIVSLVVQDDDGLKSDEFIKEITIKNLPPVVIATSSATQAKVGEMIGFDASESYDLDGTILGLEWQFGDGNVAHGEVVQHSFHQEGTYTVVLIVLDDSDEFSRAAIELKIIGEMDKIDSDGDGLPDSWEVTYGLDPNEPGDALLDLDGDTLTNLQEYDLGTDPTDSDTDDDSYPDNSDPFPLDPNKPGIDDKESAPTIDINLIMMIIVGVIILTVLLLAMFVLKNKNKRSKKPFGSNEYIQQVRDDIVEGKTTQDSEISDDELWTDLRNKYQNGQISEETYMLLEEEKNKYESNSIEDDLSGDMEGRDIIKD
jgi:uncharacterized repeat protein (TIGR01451 family)